MVWPDRMDTPPLPHLSCTRPTVKRKDETFAFTSHNVVDQLGPKHSGVHIHQTANDPAVCFGNDKVFKGRFRPFHRPEVLDEEFSPPLSAIRDVERAEK